MGQYLERIAMTVRALVPFTQPLYRSSATEGELERLRFRARIVVP